MRASFNGGGGQRVVAGDHHRADAHRAQLRELLAHAVLDHVRQLDHAQYVAALGHHQRGGTVACHLLDAPGQLGRHRATQRLHMVADRIQCALPDLPAMFQSAWSGSAVAQPCSRARRTIDLPSGVGSASEDSSAASRSWLASMPANGWKWLAWRSP
ncbi:hypothetical protein G6F60_014015 [Rhizopus arrhizus]|nr:hypothetical protein G6F60_014015 [Rhizopus arrhizus]